MVAKTKLDKPKKTALSHKELCGLAVDWLKRPASRNGPGCLVAIAETSNWINGEIPDAIGWRPYRQAKAGSVLVEVKTSRADFLADVAKNHRKNPEEGMGTYRYFMAPEGIIKIEDLPPKWGLVEVNARGHLKVRAGHILLDHREEDVWRNECNQYAEVCTLAMCLNRVGDPQKVQERLRESNNINARLAKRIEHLSKRNDQLAHDNLMLRFGENTEATPRKTSTSTN